MNNKKLASIYLCANIISSAIPFLLLPILTRFLSPTEYGNVAIFQILVSIFGAVVGLNLNGYLIRAYYKESENIKTIFGLCILICISTLVTSLMVGFFLSEGISHYIGVSPSWVYIAIIVCFFNYLMKLRLGQYQVRKEAINFAKIQILYSLVNALISILLVVHFSLGAQGRVLGWLAASCFAGIISIVLIFKDNLVSFVNITKVQLVDSIKFGFGIMPHFIGIFLLSMSDRFIISLKLGNDFAGIYMSAIQLCMFIPVVFDAINKVYVPWLFSKLKKLNQIEKNKLTKVNRVALLSMVIAACMISLLIGPLIKIILGSSFISATEVSSILVCSYFILGMYQVFTNYLIFEKKTSVLSFITILCGIIHVSLSYVLIDTHGLQGVAFSFLISSIIRLVITHCFVMKTYKTSFFF